MTKFFLFLASGSLFMISSFDSSTTCSGSSAELDRNSSQSSSNPSSASPLKKGENPWIMIYYLIAEKTNSSKKNLEFYFENSLSFAG